MAENVEEDNNVELWKVKKLIKSLEAARGNGTSMISLILPVIIPLTNSQRIKFQEL